MRTRLAVCIAFSFGVSGCGSETASAPDRERGLGPVITVEITDASIQSVEFEALFCRAPAPGGTVGMGPCPVVSNGVLEPLGAGTNPARPTTLWRAPIELPPDRYFIEVRALDDKGQVVCDGGTSLDVAPDAPTDGYFFLDCSRDERMAFGRAILTAETLRTEAPDGVQAVRYLLNCLGQGDVFLDNDLPPPVTLDGSLTPGFYSNVDFGDGPVPTDIWDEVFADLPVGPCVVELSAVDADGAMVCAVEVVFVVGFEATSQAYGFLPCAG